MSVSITILYVAIGMLCLSLVLNLVRFIKGPSLPDRIIALDLFAANLLGILAIYSIVSGIREYLDVALVLSLVAFIGTMTFAYFLIEKKRSK